MPCAQIGAPLFPVAAHVLVPPCFQWLAQSSLKLKIDKNGIYVCESVRLSVHTQHTVAYTGRSEDSLQELFLSFRHASVWAETQL